MDSDTILSILEDYLHQPPPRGYTADDALSAGIPRSDTHNVLTKAMRWRFGGEWETSWVTNDQMMLFKGRRSNFTSWEAEYELSPLLARFVQLTDDLHRGARPGMWYGDVTFREARRCLDQAKRGEEYR